MHWLNVRVDTFSAIRFQLRGVSDNAAIRRPVSSTVHRRAGLINKFTFTAIVVVDRGAFIAI
jgi:hypothetical protein